MAISTVQKKLLRDFCLQNYGPMKGYPNQHRNNYYKMSFIRVFTSHRAPSSQSKGNIDGACNRYIEVACYNKTSRKHITHKIVD